MDEVGCRMDEVGCRMDEVGCRMDEVGRRTKGGLKEHLRMSEV
jgi:hypothetical protein